MIKIIISGTYDGFSPRYASDGILDDIVTRQILDRRRFLTRDANRLFKEGYVLQPLSELGILYHKIVLLYDGFGRDGFMMASLFMPIDERIEGDIIKDALDAIVKDYKAHIQNGIANVELDWSFVKTKADELNARVKPMTWKKLPVRADASKTALIRGADNMVADYFQYPNPLNSACDGFGQVFLTELLLDPFMVSNDGVQGYKVLTTSDVNIDNPEYTIEYTNQQEGATLSKKRVTISKKDLEANSDGISLGTYSQSGFNDQSVIIKAGTYSKDGFSINVELPTLIQKKAKVKLVIYDNESKKRIPLERCNVEWFDGLSKIEKQLDKEVFHFIGTECDKQWRFSVRCNSYEVYSNKIFVTVGEQTKVVILTQKPLWTHVQRSDGNNNVLKTIYDVTDDVKATTIAETKAYYEDNGLEVDKTDEDLKAHSFTIYVKDNDKNSGSGNHRDNSPKNSQSEERESASQTPDRYFLQLTSKTKKYSPFKNYGKKLKLELGISNNINKLKGACSKKKVEQIEEAWNRGDTKQAKSNLNILLKGKGDETKEIINQTIETKEIINQTIKFINKWEKIDGINPKWGKIDGITPPKITYNFNSHRLEIEGQPQNSWISLHEGIRIYGIYKPEWYKEGEEGKQSSVSRSIQKKYKNLFWIFGIVLFCAIGGLCAYLFLGRDFSAQVETLKKRMNEETVRMKTFERENSYCGTQRYSELNQIDSNYRELAKKNSVLLEDSVYVRFKEGLELQTEYRKADSIAFEEAQSMLYEGNVPSDLDKWNTLLNTLGLTKEHKASLDSLYKKNCEKLEAERNEQEKKREQQTEAGLYKKCIGQQGNISIWKQYMSKYSPTSELALYSTKERRDKVQGMINEYEKKLVKDAENKNNSSEFRKKACDNYREYFRNGRFKDRIGTVEDDLKQPASPSKIEIQTAAALFDALKWSNIEKFDTLYNIKIRSLRNRKIAVIEKAQNISKNKYETCYKTASREENKGDRLTKLEEELGLK